MKEVGGADYLAELSRFSPTVINAADFGRMIFELAQRRDLIRVGEEIVNLAYDPPVDLSPAEQVEEAEKQLYGIAEKGRFGGGFKSFRQAITGAMEVAERAYMSPSHVTGVGTGFVDIDSLLGGFQKSDLIILAARPAMGKTSLATNMAFHAAREWMRSDGQGGGRVAFFSLEMSAEQLATRILAEQAEVSGSKIRRGKIEERDMQALIRVGAELERLPLFIDDTGGISIAQVAARARRLKRAGDLGLIIVDYLQLLTGTQSKRNENRVQEVTEITKGLKTLAKELAVPVIALSQLSRGVDNRDDKRPVLADLRNSPSWRRVVVHGRRAPLRAAPCPRRDRRPPVGVVPEQRWVMTGDFVIWNFPNAGNPQKVQRYPIEWAAALRSMIAKEPELLLPAHGLPIAGRERIAGVLDDIATALETSSPTCWR